VNAHPVVRFLVPIVVAVVLGPLAVGVTIWLLNLASNVFRLFGPDASLTFADFHGFLVYLVIMAYVIGGPIALLAGLLVSLWMIRHPPTALVVNAAAVIATVVFMAVAATGILGPVEQTNGRSNLFFMLVTAIFAANVCWFAMRRLLPPVPARADPRLIQG
jgi:hypothetical protein